MNISTCEEEIDLQLLSTREQVETHVRQRLKGRVRDLLLLLREEGLVLRGYARTYYVKQLAQHAVMEATELPLLANEIVVA